LIWRRFTEISQEFYKACICALFLLTFLSMHRTDHVGWLRCNKLLDIHGYNLLSTPLQNTPIQHSTHHKNQTLTNGFYKGHFAIVIARTTPSSNLMKFRFGLNCNRSSPSIPVRQFVRNGHCQPIGGKQGVEYLVPKLGAVGTFRNGHQIGNLRICQAFTQNSNLVLT